MRKSTMTLAAIALMVSGVASADIKVGKAISDAVCEDCHAASAGDMSDITVPEVKAVVSGAVKHKVKLTLTDTEIASLVEYFRSK